jgi:hypothetical protein
MGYRSDLEAAQARAAALEQKLASGQDANEALRQELENLKKPKKAEKPKKPEKPKKVKAPRTPGAWREFFTANVIAAIVSVLMLVGVVIYGYWSMTNMQREWDEREQQDRALVQSFVDALSAERYEDAWALTEERYRASVSQERFVREMRHHPFLKDVSGATIDDYNNGMLQTSDGNLAFNAAASRGEFMGISSDGFDLLPPSDPALINGHDFLRALLDRNFKKAWNRTHPIYRKSMDAVQFAERLAPNIWLAASTGFKLRSGDSETSNELHGFLVTNEGNVGIVLNYTDGAKTPWISEIAIGGNPSLPTP